MLRRGAAQLEEGRDRRLAVVDERVAQRDEVVVARERARLVQRRGRSARVGASAAAAIEHLLRVGQRAAAAVRAARSGGRGRRRPPRRRGRRSPRARRGRPPRPPPDLLADQRRVVEQLDGVGAGRAARAARSASVRSSPGSASCGAGGSRSPVKKHVRSPVWQAGPAGSTSASSASPSQSRRSARTACELPRRRALVPQLAARARPEVQLAGLAGARHGLGVRVGEGQDLAGAPVLDDDGTSPRSSKAISRRSLDRWQVEARAGRRTGAARAGSPAPAGRPGRRGRRAGARPRRPRPRRSCPARRRARGSPGRSPSARPAAGRRPGTSGRP